VLLRDRALEINVVQKGDRGHERIAKRRGFKTALVGVARKIMEIVFYVLRDRRAYDARLLQAH
jgi:hypothetical protein